MDEGTFSPSQSSETGKKKNTASEKNLPHNLNIETSYSSASALSKEQASKRSEAQNYPRSRERIHYSVHRGKREAFQDNVYWARTQRMLETSEESSCNRCRPLYSKLASHARPKRTDVQVPLGTKVAYCTHALEIVSSTLV